MGMAMHTAANWRHRAGLPGLLGVAVLVGGCAPVHPGRSDAILVPRIPAPEAVSDRPGPDVESTRAWFGEPKSLAEPHEMPDNTVAAPPAETPLMAANCHELGSDGTSHAITLDAAIGLAFKNQPRLRLFQERVYQAQS